MPRFNLKDLFARIELPPIFRRIKKGQRAVDLARYLIRAMEDGKLSKDEVAYILREWGVKALISRWKRRGEILRGNRGGQRRERGESWGGTIAQAVDLDKLGAWLESAYADGAITDSELEDLGDEVIVPALIALAFPSDDDPEAGEGVGTESTGGDESVAA